MLHHPRMIRYHWKHLRFLRLTLTRTFLTSPGFTVSCWYRRPSLQSSNIPNIRGPKPSVKIDFNWQRSALQTGRLPVIPAGLLWWLWWWESQAGNVHSCFLLVTRCSASQQPQFVHFKINSLFASGMSQKTQRLRVFGIGVHTWNL